LIVGSCDAVGPLACLIAGSVAFGAAAFLAVAIFTALGRAREPHDRPGSPGHAVANLSDRGALAGPEVKDRTCYKSAARYRM